MIGVLKNRMDSISRILLVANTRHTCSNTYEGRLVNVASEVPIEELSEELDRQITYIGPNIDFDKLAYIYALIVLLTYDDSPGALEKLRSVRTMRLLWIKELVHYYEQRAAFTHKSQSIDVQVEPTWREGKVESTSFGFESVRENGNTSIYRF